MPQALVLSSIAFAGMLCAVVARAGDADPSGLELLERCYTLEESQLQQAETNSRQVRDFGYCLGFVVGFVSGFAGRDASGAAGRFCPPTEARVADFADAIRQWLVAHPEGLESMGALVALQAFQWKFPCPDEVKGQPDQ
jgi:hypothetical protein